LAAGPPDLPFRAGLRNISLLLGSNHRGRHLDLNQKKGAKGAYAKAAALGDDKASAAAQEESKGYR